MPIRQKRYISTLDALHLDPTLTNYRRLKLELTLLGLTIEQAFPDLQPFLAWKGKRHLHTQIQLFKQKNRV